MQIKTEGVVLNNLKYNDKYSLVHVYTRQFGRVAYMVYRSSGRSRKTPNNIFSPLHLLEIDAEHIPSREIQKIKEARNLLPYASIPSDLQKTSLVFFLSEFLSKVLRDTNDSHLIYDFISHSMHVLEWASVSCANFHIVFMLKLIRFLGLYPNLANYQPNYLFDLRLGEFTATPPSHPQYISHAESAVLAKLRHIHYGNMHRFKFNRQERGIITERMIDYYKLHVQDFSDLKSLDVLHDLFE